MPVQLSDRLLTTTYPDFAEDWKRQSRTTADILERLQTQEGVILADQVGMGKTYVALAVAASRLLSMPEMGQVVIFAPAAVAEKWVREWRKFSETLLKPGTGIRCVDSAVRSSEEFLKLLDDGPDERKHILVVTHTALTGTLKDTFVQLALLFFATRHVRGGFELRQRIAKWSDGLRGLVRDRRFTTDRVARLLESAPATWRDVWNRMTGESQTDDPVPAALEAAARKLDLGGLRQAIDDLPIRDSKDISRRLEVAREALASSVQATWKGMLTSTELDLPLLIVDEAHRLKNPSTRIGQLFAKRVDGSSAGAFDGIFQRMLFLTATPFELGHRELIEVLRRMGAVRRPDLPVLRSLDARLEELGKRLTDAQTCSIALDEAWGRVTPGELQLFDAWGSDETQPEGISNAAREAWEHARHAVKARRSMNAALKPWVIRHERERRRTYFPGAAIIIDEGNAREHGLDVPDEAVLPFLLAARAQSVALDSKTARPLYAYGIASSFEAFTRRDSKHSSDDRDSDQYEEDRETNNALDADEGPVSDDVAWYRGEIDRALTDQAVRNAHPKIQATVERAARLWDLGEKCLIFCWYIRTGQAVERALEARIEQIISVRAGAALGTISPEATIETLKHISAHLFRTDSASHKHIRKRLAEDLAESADDRSDVLDLVVDTAIRHLRTPGYLVRYTRLHRGIDADEVLAGVNGDNPGGIPLMNRWRRFANRLTRGCIHAGATAAVDAHHSELDRISAALLGAHDEGGPEGRGASLAEVRRASGENKRGERERLIALFNTPFAPDLLVASSVMGEGIDLHQECRFVIHHDLDWNPSVLEQRTGRLDRIGAYAEREMKSIEVFEPYLAGTHDEKMFRVVKDRADWFDVVMGRSTGNDELSTDTEESRIRLHPRIREALEMDLRSPEV